MHALSCCQANTADSMSSGPQETPVCLARIVCEVVVSSRTAAVLSGDTSGLIKRVRNFLVLFPSRFFPRISLVVHLYSSTDWKKCSERSDIHTINHLSIAIYSIYMRTMTLLPVHEILLARHVKWFTNFEGFLL